LAPIPVLAQDAAPVKICVVAFLSGAAASPVRGAGRNAAELVVEMLNAGRLLHPIRPKGFGGSNIETVINRRGRQHDHAGDRVP